MRSVWRWHWVIGQFGQKFEWHVFLFPSCVFLFSLVLFSCVSSIILRLWSLKFRIKQSCMFFIKCDFFVWKMSPCLLWVLPIWIAFVSKIRVLFCAFCFSVFIWVHLLRFLLFMLSIWFIIIFSFRGQFCFVCIVYLMDF